MSGFEGKVAFVSGANRGLGLADSFIDLISLNAKKEANFGAALHSFLANQKSWHKVREEDYANIASHIKVTLLYSEQDWSSHWVREQNEKRIGGQLRVTRRQQLGHFSFLECPDHIVTVIKESELN